MALLHVNSFSDILGMCVNFDVILPQKATRLIGMESKAEDTYPTLYLLHGKSDDHTIWQRRTSIERYAAAKNLAVVMPTVHLSFYTDMAHGNRYFTYLAEELPLICRSFFKGMSAKKEDNFVAGLSMGGYGALKAALATDSFGAAASLSGAIDIVEMANKKMLSGSSYWEDIYGDTTKIEGSDNDIFALAEKRKKEGRDLPKLYMWCGTEDFLYSQNVKARGVFTELGYDLTYEESPGDHQWKYWDEKIQTVIDWLPVK